MIVDGLRSELWDQNVHVLLVGLTIFEKCVSCSTRWILLLHLARLRWGDIVHELLWGVCLLPGVRMCLCVLTECTYIRQHVNVRQYISDTHACGSLTRPIGEGTDIRVTSQAHMTEYFLENSWLKKFCGKWRLWVFAFRTYMCVAEHALSVGRDCGWSAERTNKTKRSRFIGFFGLRNACSVRHCGCCQCWDVSAGIKHWIDCSDLLVCCHEWQSVWTNGWFGIFCRVWEVMGTFASSPIDPSDTRVHM
jgi:hypothetical protein